MGVLLRRQLSTLFNPISVAVAMIVGGVIILIVESVVHRVNTRALENVSWRQALGIGIAQIASLWAGMSRSASTLVGGLLVGLDRPTALRFSFYLSIPTMLAAGLFDLARSRDQITSAALPAFLIGLVVSFIVAYFVIRFFLSYVARRNLVPFAIYRIIVGIIVLLYFSIA
jgi:undecaprenyl-diphosphatase